MRVDTLKEYYVVERLAREIRANPDVLMNFRLETGFYGRQAFY